MRFLKPNNQYRITNNKRGFSLLEILVVVSIISLLVTIGITSYSTLTKNARDARRKTDLLQIQAAIEMYKGNSTYSSYPVALPTLVAGNYMAKIPTDPRSGKNYALGLSPTSCDEIVTACTSYTLSTGLESGAAYRLTPLGEVDVCAKCDTTTTQRCVIYVGSGSCSGSASNQTYVTDCGCTTAGGTCTFKGGC